MLADLHAESVTVLSLFNRFTSVSFVSRADSTIHARVGQTAMNKPPTPMISVLGVLLCQSQPVALRTFVPCLPGSSSATLNHRTTQGNERTKNFLFLAHKLMVLYLKKFSESLLLMQIVNMTKKTPPFDRPDALPDADRVNSWLGH
jgi:hypothetical protein